MPNIMEIIVKAVDQASDVLNNIGKQGEQATKDLEKSFKNAGKAMTDAGKTLTTKVTAPLAGLATASVTTVAKFDDSMSQVAAISGATGNDLERLRDLAKDLGATTRYSASEAADAMTYLALAGYDTNQILEATPGMLNLAAAAGMDLSTAADIVTDTMSGFQMNAERAGEAADIFAAASSKSNTNVEQLGEAMKYASSTANAAGMDLQQTAAVLGVLADSGIKGSMAGTTFNAMLRDLKKANEDGKLAIEDTTIALYNQDGSMRDLGAVMADIEKATEGMTTAQRDAALSAIFGEQAIRGVNIMLATGSERYKELEQAMYNSTGASQEMAETMEDNVAGAFRAFKSQVEGILIQIGEQLAPVIKDTIIPLLSGFGEKISSLIEWFAGLDDNTKNTILTITGIAAAVGPALLVFGELSTGIGSLIETVKSLGGTVSGIGSSFSALSTAAAGSGTALSTTFTAAAAPIAAVAAAVALVAGAFVTLWENNEEFRDKMTEIWERIKGIFTDFAQGIVDRLNELGFEFENFTEVISALWNGFCELLAPMFEGVFTQVANILEGTLGVLTGLLDVFIGIFTGDWEKAWEGAKGIFTSAWDLIKNTFENWVNVFEGLASTILDWFGTTWDEVWTSVKDFFEEVWQGISDFFENIWNGITEFFSKALEAIKNTISKVWNDVKEVTSTIWDGIKGAITGVIDGIKNVVNKSFNWIKNIISKVWNDIKSVTSTVWDSIVSVIKGVFNSIKEAVSKSFDWIKNKISKVWDDVKEVTSTIWDGIKGAITGVIDGIKEAVSKSFDWVKNKISKVWDDVKEVTKSVWDSMVTIIKAPINGIIELINGLIGALNNVKIDIPKIPDWVPGIGGKGGGTIGFNIPKIPKLARGGFIKGGNPTPAIIGEGRYDEAVIPLSENVLGKLAEMISSRTSTPKVVEHRHFGTLRVIVENAQQGFEEIVDAVIDEIRREVRA